MAVPAIDGTMGASYLTMRGQKHVPRTDDRSAMMIARSGRDGYIQMQALAYAIEAIELLPRQWQEYSNQQDMIALLEASAVDADLYRLFARAKLQQRGVMNKNGQP